MRQPRRLVATLSVAMVATVVPVVGGEAGRPAAHLSMPLRARSLEVPFVFGLVGVTWPADGPAPGAVRVRTSLDGSRWSAWHPLAFDGDDGPDSGGRAGTAPLWVGRARHAQVEASGAVRDVRVSFVDPGVAAGPSLASASASPATPTIVSRRSWGADEKMRRGAPRYADAVDLAFVHHTATGNGYGRSEVPRILRGIQAYHVRGLGWDDIGYNALVDRFGRIYEGRAGGIDRAVIGAHAKGFNAGSFGVAVLGEHSSSPPSADARKALTSILSWKLDLNHVDPLSTVVRRSAGSNRYPAGTKVRLKTISGHRDVGHTSCPGQALYAALGPLRTAVSNHGSPKIVGPWTSGGPFTPNGDGLRDSVVVAARLTSRAHWRAEIRAPDGALLTTKSGTGDRLWFRWRGTDDQGRIAVHGRNVVRLIAWNSKGRARPADLGVTVWNWPDGTALRTPGGAYAVEDGRLRPFSGTQARRSRVPTSELVPAPSAITDAYPTGDPIGFREGALVRADVRTWLISAGSRREVSDEAFAELGFDERAVLDASAGELAPHPLGAPVTADVGHPDGVALRGDVSGMAWRLGGDVRPFTSDAAYASHALRSVDAVGPADAEIMAGPHGAVVGFRDGSLLRAPSSAKVYVVSDGARRWISSYRRFLELGFQAADIRDVSDAEVAVHPEGPSL